MADFYRMRVKVSAADEARFLAEIARQGLSPIVRSTSHELDEDATVTATWVFDAESSGDSWRAWHCVVRCLSVCLYYRLKPSWSSSIRGIDHKHANSPLLYGHAQEVKV